MKKIFTILLIIIPFLGFSQLESGLAFHLPLNGNLSVVSEKGTAELEPGKMFPMDTDRFGEPCAGDFTNTFFNASVELSVENGRSLSFWVKRNENVGDYIFETTAFPLISRSKDSLKIDLFNYDRTGYTFYLEKGKWMHVVWVYAKQGVHSIFINGKREEFYTKPLTLNKDARLLAGNAGCSLDDIRVYERELEFDDIEQLYTIPSSCILTSINEGSKTVLDQSDLLFATDVVGKVISDTRNYSGLLILHYKNGKTEKLLKTQ